MNNSKNNSTFSKDRRKILKTSAASMLMLPTIGLSQGKRSDLGIIGQQAPELEVPTWIDGKGNPTTFKMSDQKNKFVFMEFWQYWCPGCHSHGLPSLKKISDEFKDSPHLTALSIQTVFEGEWTNTADKMTEIQHKFGLGSLTLEPFLSREPPKRAFTQWFQVVTGLLKLSLNSSSMGWLAMFMKSWRTGLA